MRFPRWLSFVLSAALVAGLYVLLSQQIEKEEILDAVRSVSFGNLASAVAVMWLTFAVATERYRLILCRLLDNPPSFIALFRLNLLSIFVAHLAPIGLAADLTRVGYARLFMKIPTRTAIESVIFDRLVALLGILALGLAFLPVQWSEGVGFKVVTPQVVLWFGCIAALIGLNVLSRHPVVERWAALAELARSVRGFFGLFAGPRALAAQAVLAIGYSGTFGIVMWSLARGMGFSPDPLAILAFSPLLLLVQNLPIFYVGWGAREAAVVGTLGATGVLEPGQALAVSVATGVVFLIASIPGGVVWLWRLIAADRTEEPPKAGS